MNGVYAIVVTYNPDKGILRKQYETIAGQVDGIIYIDNNSQNRSFLAELELRGALVICNNNNVGLAKAQNQGIALAKEKNSDFIFLLDQDSIPEDKCVEKLLACYKELGTWKKVAVIGPIIKNRYDNDKLNNKGILLIGPFVYRIVIGKVTDVSFCIASGSLIPMKVFENVGTMKEKLFIDSIDQEWCFRAKSRGYKIFQTNTTWISHTLGNGRDDKIRSHSPLREYYIIRNSIWMSRQKYIPLGYRMRKVFMIVCRVFFSLIRGDKAYFKSGVSGLIDGRKL